MGTGDIGRLSIRNLSSGRNAIDPPQSLPETQCAEAENVDWYGTPFGRKRPGVSTVTLTSTPFTGLMSSLARHVPTTDETLAELWATDDAATPNVGRLAGGTVWAAPTLKDVPTGNGWDVTYASLNGKLFIAYKSGVDRLHVWDPVSNSVRRTGLAVMAAPTVADTGAGTYAAVIRYYRTRATEQRTGVTVRRSEPSGSTSFTPSGAGTAARITKGTLPGEVETHWEVEASTDNVTFYRIATVVIGTATYDDSAVTGTYVNNPVSALTGTYTLQTSYKFIASDQGRILGFGNYTATNKQATVEFSAVLGSSDIGDDERVPTGNYIGLDDNDSGVATALCGPVNGSFFAGKYRQFWKLTPTGSVAVPYTVICLSKIVGVVGPKAIAVAEDEQGRPLVTWMSLTGPYRLGVGGPEYIGKGIEDYVLGSAATGNMVSAIATAKVICHVQWFRDLRQVWMWMAVGAAATDPSVIGVFSVGRAAAAYGQDQGYNPGWSVYRGGIGNARCSTIFSVTIGAAMSSSLAPYIGSTLANSRVGICNSGTQDFTVNYGAVITTKAYEPWGDNWTGAIVGGQLGARAQSATSVGVKAVGDFGAQTTNETVSLAATGSETRVQPRIGSAFTIAEIQVVQFTVADDGSANITWMIDEFGVTWRRGSLVVS